MVLVSGLFSATNFLFIAMILSTRLTNLSWISLSFLFFKSIFGKGICAKNVFEILTVSIEALVKFLT